MNPVFNLPELKTPTSAFDEEATDNYQAWSPGLGG